MAIYPESESGTDSRYVK